MADLTVYDIDHTGVDPTYVAAAGGGDTFDNDGHTFFHAFNGSGGGIDITIDSPVDCNQGFAHDVVVTVPAGEDRMIGRFPVGRFHSSCSGTYSGVTSLTVAAIRLVP